MLWLLQIASLAEIVRPGLLLTFALAVLLVAPSKFRLSVTVIAFGLAGWLLPANQLALADFYPPSEESQVFEVISTSQRWGMQHRYWISLTESEQRVGYLELGRDVRLKLGASYRGKLALQPTPKLERAGFSATLDAEPELVAEPAPWQQFIGDSRIQFQNRVTGVSPDAVGLVVGLTIGERSQISESLLLAMRELSLTHIVAVSGANLAIAMAAAFLLVRLLGLGRRIRFVAASATALGYAAVVGPEPSVLRALFMAHVVLLALALGRRAAALLAIAWASIILLALDPFLASDFGFALSVAATCGILLLADPLQQRLAKIMPRPVALALGVSLAAQLFTLPILLLLQPGIPTYSVLANLLVMPLLTPITLLGLLAFVLQPIGAVTELLSHLASWAAGGIEVLALLIVTWPYTRIPWPDLPLGSVLAAAIALLLTVALVHHSWGRACSLLAAALAASGLSVSMIQETQASIPGDWIVIACDVGQGDALLFRSANAVALIDVGPKPALIESCLRLAGVSRIDLLVITHFDLDHVGGLQGLLDCCTLGTVMLPQFEDNREIQDRVEVQLANLPGLRVLTGRANLAGTLGDTNWQVLSPGPIESSGSDSNSASIVLLIENPEIRMLALGDVPADVQERIAHLFAAKLAKASGATTLLKVSHHGSADQSVRLAQLLRPDFAIFSVGRDNNYGHPTATSIEMARLSGAKIVRTDLMGNAVLRKSAGILTFD